MKPSSVSQRIRNQSGASFEKEVAQSAEFYRTHLWDWGSASPQGPAYRSTLNLDGTTTGEGPTMVLAQGNPRTVGRPGQMVPVEANAVDFVGWSADPPIGVAFDCKVVTGRVSFKLDLANKKKPDAAQVRWLRDFQNAGGLAGYLLCDRGERVCWFLTGSDLTTLADGASVVFASKSGAEFETKRLALMRSGRSQLIGAQAVVGEPRLVRLDHASLPWDIAALFRVHLGISAPSAEQGLVRLPGDRFPSAKG